MMITSESDYAVRIIRALKDGELLPLEQICRSTGAETVCIQDTEKKLEKFQPGCVYAGARRRCILDPAWRILTLLDIIKAAGRGIFS